MKMKKRSSQWTQFVQLRKEAWKKKIQDFNGVWTRDLASGGCGQFLKSRVPCSANRTATFNPADVALDRNADVHPMSGPGEQFNTAKLDIPKELKGPINICLETEKPF